jgi:NAD(P)-dependent dehydrogenase (short-subunit alcohol dehydrogenase family)
MTLPRAILPPSQAARVAARCADVSYYTNPIDASYGASKAAAWSLTNGIRIELAHQGTLVIAVHASFIDTDKAAGIDVPKISPESVAQQAFDAVEAGQIEVLADDRSRFVRASLSRDHELIYPPVQPFWDAAVQGPASSGQLREIARQLTLEGPRASIGVLAQILDSRVCPLLNLACQWDV